MLWLITSNAFDRSQNIDIVYISVGYVCLAHIYLVDQELGVLWNVWIETHTGVCIKCIDYKKNDINLLNMIFSSIQTVNLVVNNFSVRLYLNIYKQV